MSSLLRVAALGICLSFPMLAHAQIESDDWRVTHPYEQPERMEHGDPEVQEIYEWELTVFEANEYRYRKLQEEWARHAATLPPADYGKPTRPPGN